MTIELDDQVCLLPPTRAAWLPAGLPHRVLMRGVVAYRSLYFQPEHGLPTEMAVLAVNPLLREIIERMAIWPWDKPAAEQHCTLALLQEELAQAPRESWQLPLPSDSRLAGWLQEVKRGDTLPDRLNRLAERVGASDKTIGRIFMRETGMSYQAWRQQWRLLRALELLAEAEPISRVAATLEFASDSAFISFFRQHTGQTRCAISTLGVSRIGRARLHHQGLQRQRRGCGSPPPPPHGRPAAAGPLSPAPAWRCQFGSGVLVGHHVQAQAAGNQGCDQDFHLVCSGVVEMTR